MAHSILLLLTLFGLSAGLYKPLQAGAGSGRLSIRQVNPSGRVGRPLTGHQRADAAWCHTPVEPCTAVSARVDLVSGVSDQVSGVVFLYQECPDRPVLITGHISGLAPGKHGFHVHQNPNLMDECAGAGGHFNPFNNSHGPQNAGVNERHVGDLGNIEANSEGVAELNIIDDVISLFPGKADVFRRAIVIHSGEDDLGRGGNEGSVKTGNAGMRLACGIIAPNNTPRCY